MLQGVRSKTAGLLMGLLVATSAAAPALAGEMRFSFRNPSFGGNPFLGDFLIQGAQLENQFANGGGGGGGGTGSGGGGGGGIGDPANPFSNFQLPDADDFSTGTTVIIGAPTN